MLFILIPPIHSQMKTNGVDINCGRVLWAEWLPQVSITEP